LTIDPLLFLACSTLLVAVSLTALVVAAFPAIQDVSRAARSAEKLFDRLDRELSPTLEAIRIAGLELSDLSDEMSQGVQSASAVVQQVDIGLTEVKKQASNARLNTRSVWVGVKAAWQTWRDRGESAPREQISSASKTSLPASSDLDPPARQLNRRNRDLDRAQGSILEDEDS
jgi:vancomycin resistance protein YoaR